MDTVVTAMAHPPTTDWLRLAAAATPETTALAAQGTALDYAGFDHLVDRTAASLVRELGVGEGSRLGIACAADRRLDTVILLWATWRLGAVAVVLDPAGRAVPADPVREWGLVDVVTSVPPADSAVDHQVAFDAAAHHTWVPTSGSAGTPRPVILTHGNVATAVGASRRRLGNGPADRWLLVLPLFHVGGLSILWRAAEAGGTVVLHDRFDAVRVAAALRSGEVTVVSLVPTMLHRLLDTDPGPYPPPRAVLLGGAAAPRSLVERGLDAGLPVLATYGMTETCSQVATVTPGEERESLGTVGRPLDGFAVTIDRPGEDGVGEILVDGRAVSPGYAFEPPRSGPHRTGDLGRLDPAGQLVVAGRGDETIITGGENVSPAAVEAVLCTHPAVDQVVVHGAPDAEWGELVVAVVVAPGDTSTVFDLEGFARDHLTAAQRPRRWRFVPELPLLPNGKVDRRAVRTETLAAGT